jgi:hypothetical protein
MLKVALLVEGRQNQLLVLNIALLCHVLFLTEMVGQRGRGMREFNEDPNKFFFSDAGTGGRTHTRFFDLCRERGAEDSDAGFVLEYIHQGSTCLRHVLLPAMQVPKTHRALGAAFENIVMFYCAPGNALFSSKPRLGNRKAWPAELRYVLRVFLGTTEVDRHWMELDLRKVTTDPRDV